VPKEEGLETARGGLELAEGIVTGPAAGPESVIFPWGTEPAVSAPKRARRARGPGFRRAVWTRSPAFFGLRDGATTQQAEPCGVRERESQ
jgi:hypothetical protein